MGKFRFRLATLQRLRESHRDEMRTKLAEAYQAEKMLGEQAQAVHAEEAELRKLHRNSLQKTDTNVNQLLDVQRYSAALKGRLATIHSQSEMLNAEIEKRRQALVEADQQVRILENLRDRKSAAHREEQLRAEAKILDEVALRGQESEF